MGKEHLRTYSFYYSKFNISVELHHFETHEFKQYDRWTKLSKDFIKEQGDFIILKPLFETYFKMLEPFYMGIYAELTEYHEKDFKETIKLAAEVNVQIPNIYYKLISCN